MRMSCNGCRVLRKGCSENCSIRPCLQWIKNPESQANATVFLAKFYGRAGLMNLINAGPENLRPDIFRSLLYEACGRIVNPIYGSVGLLWSGNWQLCQSAVESVLQGFPIVSISSETKESASAAPIKGFDIRHVGKGSDGRGECFLTDLHKIGKCRTRFKRSGAAASPAWSHESAESRRENDSVFSVETAEVSHLSQGEQNCFEGEIGLELTLGRREDRSLSENFVHTVEEDCGVDLQLELAV